MRRALLVLVALTAPLAARDASSSTAPAFSSLPAYHLDGPPTPAETPRHVTQKEKLDGIFVALPPKEERAQMEQAGFHQVNVFLTEKQKKQAEMPRFSAEDEGADACVTTGQDFGQGESDWPTMFQPQTTVQIRKPRPGETGSGFGGVAAIHVERLIQTGAKAELQITDAFVDPETQGTKLIRKGTMALSLVSTGPLGADVWAARDQDTVHFVVRAPKLPDNLPPDVRFLRSASRRLTAQMPNGFGSGSSDCGFLRTSLHVGSGGGQMASIQGTALLPPEKEDAPGPTDGNAPPPVRQIGTRPFFVHLSASQTSSDKEPLLSVTYAWASKAKQQAF